MHRYVRYALKGIGIILFLAILLTVDVTEALHALERASLPFVLAATICFPVIYLIKSWRWHLLGIAHGANATFHHSMSLYMSGLFLGLVTPGRVGEAFKIPGLVQQGLAWKDATMLTILDRLLDLAVLGIATIIAICILVTIKSAAFFLGLGVIAVLLIALFFWKLPKLRSFAIPKLPKHTWIQVTALTFLNWFVYFLQIFLLAEAFSLGVPLASFFASMILVTIVSALPIAPAGLGTRDAAMLYMFAHYGIPDPIIVAFSFSIFILTLLSSTIGLFYWLRHPLTTRH